VCLCVHACADEYVCVCVCMYVYVCVCACVCVCDTVCVYGTLCVYMGHCVCACVCVRQCVRVYILYGCVQCVSLFFFFHSMGVALHGMVWVSVIWCGLV
jgi:hypothetical protein